MRISLFGTLALYNLQAAAFPSLPLDTEELEKLSNILGRVNTTDNVKARSGLPVLPGFNAEEQYISTTGDHQFVRLLFLMLRTSTDWTYSKHLDMVIFADLAPA